MVTFHAAPLLPLGAGAGAGTIPAATAVQIHSGDFDPVTAAELPAMEAELRAAGVAQWKAEVYGNCAHGWTDPASAAYREREAAHVRKTPGWPRSWADFTLRLLCFHGNAWANSHLLGPTWHLSRCRRASDRYSVSLVSVKFSLK